MDAIEDIKPQCGGGKEQGEYDLPLHVAGLCTSPFPLILLCPSWLIITVIVLAASLLGAGFPVTAKKIKWLKVPPTVFFACKHFGTGVLVATAFVHVGLQGLELHTLTDTTSFFPRPSPA